MIKAGTHLSRDEANAERVKRKGANEPKSSKIEGWVWDWNQGKYVEYEMVEEPITDKELQALISVKEAALKFSKGDFNEDGFKKQHEGPPQGITVETAQGVSADDAAGAATTNEAEAQSDNNKWLSYNLREF